MARQAPFTSVTFSNLTVLKGEAGDQGMTLEFLGGQDDPMEQNQNRLTRWERLAQVLLGGNEFMYVD